MPYDDRSFRSRHKPEALDALAGLTASLAGELPGLSTAAQIDTLDGPVSAGALKAGDLVLTRDSGYRPVRWVGRLPAAEATGVIGRARSVRVLRGALGENVPARDLTVSPRQRIVLSGIAVEALTGEVEAFVAPLHAVGAAGIDSVADAADDFILVLFDSHEILRADGCWTESFCPAEHSVRALLGTLMAGLLTAVPAFADADGFAGHVAARADITAGDAVAALTGHAPDADRAA
jgi:hypothetical protein